MKRIVITVLFCTLVLNACAASIKGDEARKSAAKSDANSLHDELKGESAIEHE